ncbi:Putative odorant receptor 13a [Habropoda laboriosa]|uniref:Putative odorant receptor 13a n=1 Tax=Habropoda laboriosa TaxID=597456 RepID=A0A0L7QP63_9HYME|nr:Putative odorant receptor 13a [Habropoda laboriosa]
MQTEKDSDISINLSKFFLRNVGLWRAENHAENRKRKALVAYTIWNMFLAIVVETRDMYFTWFYKGDILYVSTNLLSVILTTIKLTVVLIHKVEFMSLIDYMYEHFWNVDYDLHEKRIMDNCKKTCIIFTSSVTTIGICAIISYIATPFIMHSQSNKSERAFLFDMWLNLPLTVSPYYEGMLAVQISGLYFTGICYFCFDNIFCIMSVHLSGQFRILQYRLTKLSDVQYQISEKNMESVLEDCTRRSYEKFKSYVRQHQTLIDYYEKLEHVYTKIILGQVLLFSVLICLFGYQILLANTSLARRSIFMFLICGAMVLLFMFTYSCNMVIEQSDNIAFAAYSALWTGMPMNKTGKKLRHDLIMVIGRSRRVCCLTANGFFPVSLETYTTIVGLWMASNRFEQRVRNITLCYTLIAILFALWIQMTDLYYSWGDFGACLYTACNILSLTIPFLKILVLLAHKNDFFHLILHLQREFLHADYDDYEKKILLGCQRQCTFFVCFFTLFTKGTVISYIVNPLIANIGKNESERILPFNMWVNLPLSMTPYYEITFSLQVLSLYHIGVSYFCFDNFLCIMNLHAATQFRVLQYRMANMTDLKDKERKERNMKTSVSSACFATECYNVLKDYIRQHQNLIAYCNKLEKVFNIIVLGQLLMFSMLICLDGFQILMVANLGKNESDREHIYDMWLDLPLSVTPYYEITYIIQKCYIKFKNCIQQHQALIEFCATLEEVFTVIVLGQVLMSSILICFIGYQVLLIKLSFESRVAFACFLMMGMSQLWMFTYSCDCITTESLNIAESVYAGPWINLPMDKFGKLLRKELQMLILRARRPSALTACGFFSISLETFTKVCMYMAGNGLAMVLDIIKIFTLVVHKKKFLGLIEYMQKNFWHLNYDQYENSVLAQAKRMCIYFVCVLSFFSQSSVLSYIIRPLVYHFACFSMSLKYRQDVSFRLANFFLYVVGFWFAANRIEEWFRNAAILYTIVTVFFVMWLQLRGLYFSWGNFEVCMYMACNSIALVLDIIKIFVLVVRKKKFLGLIEYMQKNFFHLNYDQDENSIIAHAKRTCIYFVCVFSFCSQSTVFSYIIRPFVSNLGKNESDREHIYDMWLDLPLSVTPYYEITYIIQALSVYQVGVCYLCFDNIFFIMCLHVAGQFRILQYRIANVSGLSEIVKSNDNTSTAELYSEKCYIKFKNCIQQHQALIEFCEILEEVFTVIVLGQVLMFSIIICFAGYEVLLITLPFESRVAFTCFLITGVSQLWMFTYSCNCITTESLNIAESVYAGPWINLPMDKFGKLLRKDLQVLILRARRPSALTACGFFSITLETFTKIMSTSMSYFTLLKQSAEDTVNS